MSSKKSTLIRWLTLVALLVAIGTALPTAGASQDGTVSVGCASLTTTGAQAGTGTEAIGFLERPEAPVPSEGAVYAGASGQFETLSDRGEESIERLDDGRSTFLVRSDSFTAVDREDSAPVYSQELYASLAPVEVLETGETNDATTVRRTSLPMAGDYDGDGIPNAQEIAIGMDFTSRDSDADGLSDCAELRFHGTSPTNQDTDGDGVADHREVYPRTDVERVTTHPDGVIGAREVARESTWIEPDGPATADLRAGPPPASLESPMAAGEPVAARSDPGAADDEASTVAASGPTSDPTTTLDGSAVVPWASLLAVLGLGAMTSREIGSNVPVSPGAVLAVVDTLDPREDQDSRSHPARETTAKPDRTGFPATDPDDRSGASGRPTPDSSTPGSSTPDRLDPPANDVASHDATEERSVDGSPAGFGLRETDLVPDDVLVERLLESAGGRAKQTNIVEATTWSKSKVSRLLSRMADEGKVEKVKLGRENLICLAGHEPESIASPLPG